MLYATTKDVYISIVILMKGVFAHAEAKEAKAHRTEMSMSQKSLENAISEKCYYAYRINCDYW